MGEKSKTYVAKIPAGKGVKEPLVKDVLMYDIVNVEKVGPPPKFVD